MRITSWYEMLKEDAESDGEDFDSLVFSCSIEELKKPFDSSYGGTEGSPFTAWGKDWVYFPICYDGAEWIGHAPRNPCEISMFHQGGGQC